MLGRMTIGFLRRAALAAVLVALAAPASAHPVPFRLLDARPHGTGLDRTLVVHIFDAAHDLNVDPPERLLDPRTLNERATALMALLGPRFSVAADGRTLTPFWSTVEPIVDRQSLRLHFRYTLASPPGTLRVAADLFPFY